MGMCEGIGWFGGTNAFESETIADSDISTFNTTTSITKYWSKNDRIMGILVLIQGFFTYSSFHIPNMLFKIQFL